MTFREDASQPVVSDNVIVVAVVAVDGGVAVGEEVVVAAVQGGAAATAAVGQWGGRPIRGGGGVSRVRGDSIHEHFIKKNESASTEHIDNPSCSLKLLFLLEQF